uniref:Uncharacterized protein n=1 Tax=Mustela putorius furo TaxID=9669 RepID=M3XTH7_MUSPF
MDVDQTATGLMAYVNSEGLIKYDKPMKVVSICNLDIFYFPFDEQNCTLTFSSFIYTVENVVLGMEKKVQEISNTSQNLIRSKGEWVLLGIHQRMMKMTVGTNQYDQIIFHVAIRRRPRLYVINLLVPSGFLVAIDALSFYLPAESENRAPFKMTLLLGYNVFLLMMNDLLPATGTPLISMAPPSIRRLKARLGSGLGTWTSGTRSEGKEILERTLWERGNTKSWEVPPALMASPSSLQVCTLPCVCP